MVRAKVVDGGPIVGTMDTFYYPSGGTGVGQVQVKDSVGSTVTSYASQAAAAQQIATTYQPDIETYLHDVGVYIGAVNTPKDNLLEFNEAIQWLDNNLVWLWGSVETGGFAFYYPNDPIAPNVITTVYCNGCYFNGLQYRYHMTSGMEPNRPFNQLGSVFFAYMADSAGITMVSAAGDVPYNLFLPGTQTTPPGYIDGGYKSLEEFPASKQTVITLVPPFYAHLTAFDFNADNCSGGMNDLATIHDDEHSSPLDPTWDHIAGHWYGAESIQPNPSDKNRNPGDWEEPEYNPSEDDRKETEEDQFDIDAINSGLVTIFNPKMDDIRDFSRFLFSGITEDMASFFKRLLTTPLDYVISLAQVHYAPEVDGASEIKFGGIGSGVSSMIVKDQFQKIEYGSVDIPAQYGGFVDYSGYTRLKVYLPYCGKHEIDCDLSIGATITLTYWVDNLSGACVAQLVYDRGRRRSDDREQTGQVYEFTGNVFEFLPLSAADYRAAVQGALTAAAGVGQVIAGNHAGLGAIASGVMAMKPNIQHASKTGSNFGYMGSQYAYIEVARPTPAEPRDYYLYGGYNAAYSEYIKNLSGFVKIRQDGANFKSIPYITDEESNELTKLFESGVRI